MTKRKADVAARLARADEIARDLVASSLRASIKGSTSPMGKERRKAAPRRALLVAVNILLERGR